MITEQDIAKQRRLFEKHGFKPMLKQLGYRMGPLVSAIADRLTKAQQWEAIERSDMATEMIAFLVTNPRLVVLAGIHATEGAAKYVEGLGTLCAQLRGLTLKPALAPLHSIPCSEEIKAIGQAILGPDPLDPNDMTPDQFWKWQAIEALSSMAVAVAGLNRELDGATRARVAIGIREAWVSTAKRLEIYSGLGESQAEHQAHKLISAALKEVITIEVLEAPTPMAPLFRVEELANHKNSEAN